MTKEEFIAYLIDKNSFRMLAPRTFLYESKDDVIVVYITEAFVMIVTDGPEAVPSQSIEGVDESEIDFWGNMLKKLHDKF